MSPRPRPRAGDWVSLPPRRDPSPRRPQHEYDDYDHDFAYVEERRPGQTPWGSPRQSMMTPEPRSPRQRPETLRRRNPFDEPEIIEIAPNSPRRAEERRIQAERARRIQAEEEANQHRNTVRVAHERYQDALNGAAADNERLKAERDVAAHRAAMAERDAHITRREMDVEIRALALNAEERRDALRPRIHQAPPPDRDPGLDALHRAQADHQRQQERRRQNDELHRRNRERDRERGVRRGSPIRYDDRDARRDRRR